MYPFSAIVITTIYILLLGSVCDAQTPLKMTNLTKQDRAAWYEALKWPKGCEDAFQKTYNVSPGEDYGGLQFHDLKRGEYLVEVACYSGAYQPGSIFMYYNKQTPSSARLLKLPGFESEDDEGKALKYSEVSGLATFNKRTKVLEVFSKYRGVGDCGLYVRYRFMRGQPVVIEAREQDCDEKRIRRLTDPRRWARIRMK
jgi:hypothetical protein